MNLEQYFLLIRIYVFVRDVLPKAVHSEKTSDIEQSRAE